MKSVNLATLTMTYCRMSYVITGFGPPDEYERYGPQDKPRTRQNHNAKASLEVWMAPDDFRRICRLTPEKAEVIITEPTGAEFKFDGLLYSYDYTNSVCTFRVLSAITLTE